MIIGPRLELEIIKPLIDNYNKNLDKYLVNLKLELNLLYKQIRNIKNLININRENGNQINSDLEDAKEIRLNEYNKIKELIKKEERLIKTKLENNNLKYDNETKHLEHLNLLNIEQKRTLIEARKSKEIQKQELLNTNIKNRKKKIGEMIRYIQKQKKKKESLHSLKLEMFKIKERIEVLKLEQKHNLSLKKNCHKNHIELKKKIKEMNQKIGDNKESIRLIVVEGQSNNNSVIHYLNQNEELEREIQLIKKSKEFNIIQYMNELDIKNQSILNNINILENKERELNKIYSSQEKKLKKYERENTKNKITQESISKDIKIIDQKIDILDNNTQEISIKISVLDLNNNEYINKNKTFINNLFEKEKILLERIEKDFKLVESNLLQKINRNIKINENNQLKLKILEDNYNQALINIENNEMKKETFNFLLKRKLQKLNYRMLKEKKNNYQISTV